MTTPSKLALLGAVALAFAACGDGGGDSTAEADQDAIRTIEVDMIDIAFEPGELEVAAGETVRFVFTNRGEIAHDAFVGDTDAQDDHAADMADEHSGGHADREGVTVGPGETAELTHTFDEGELPLIGCHQPGHYDAGMVTSITVN